MWGEPLKSAEGCTTFARWIVAWVERVKGRLCSAPTEQSLVFPRVLEKGPALTEVLNSRLEAVVTDHPLLLRERVRMVLHLREQQRPAPSPAA
jgi:hypothetical protein